MTAEHEPHLRCPGRQHTRFTFVQSSSSEIEHDITEFQVGRLLRKSGRQRRVIFVVMRGGPERRVSSSRPPPDSPSLERSSPPTPTSLVSDLLAYPSLLLVARLTSPGITSATATVHVLCVIAVHARELVLAVEVEVTPRTNPPSSSRLVSPPSPALLAKRSPSTISL